MQHQRPRVLIVEDERIVAMDLQLTLHDLGYDAFAIASSADEALEKVTGILPDVVLMDIRIKGDRDGIETARVLRERFDVPIIFLTAHADDATVERAKVAAPHGYLLKPVKSAELRSSIEVTLYRSKLERQLRESERWFSTTLRSINDAVITVDLAGQIKFMNPAAEALTGTGAAEGVGRYARDILHLDKPFDAQHATPIDAALAWKRPVEVKEGTLVAADASEHVIADLASPVESDGELLGAVMVFRDITEEKALRHQLELADRLASLGTMAAGVAHEINNPLAVILGNGAFVTEQMQRLRQLVATRLGDLGTGATAFLDDAMEAQRDLVAAVDRISTIIGDLKSFSRPQVQTGQTVNINDLFGWVVRSTSHELRHRARVITEIASDLPPVKADEHRLGQVLVNLMVNAAHAIKPGAVSANRVELRASCTTDKVIIEVTDTGCGMSDATQRRIFEPFFTTKPAGVGTGLGLSICHGIVGSFGGTLSVESSEGLGSKFRIALPIACAPSVAADKPAASGKARVLVIDDEVMVLRAITRSLAGHDVVPALGVDEATRLLRSGESFDLILLDTTLMSRGITGFYASLLEQSPEIAQNIVLMTGAARGATADAFLRSVGNPRMEKPFDGATLFGHIETALRRRQRSAAEPRIT